MSNTLPVRIIDETIEIVQSNGLFSSVLNLESKREAIDACLQDRRSSLDDVHKIIRKILSDIGDRHSHLVTPVDQETRFEAEAQYPDSQVIHQNMMNYGYLRVPGFFATRYFTEHQFASDLSDRLKKLDSSRLSGWVIDLENNSGGNMWPMLAGLAPLLGVAVVGYFRDRHGVDTPWNIGESFVGFGETVVLDFDSSHSKLRQSDLPIAVLTSEDTSSSGEAIVVAFRGLPRSRQFGVPTFGVSTANTGFKLSDGSMIWLATSKFVDSNFNEYGTKINPDVTINSDGGESAIDIALRWFSSK